MNILKIHSYLKFLFILLHSHILISQESTYNVSNLNQETVTILSNPSAYTAIESGDTTYTLYKNISVNFKQYFVHGIEYDNIFNPSPTGVIINNQEFSFYCGIEKAVRRSINNALEFHEFTYLGKRYLSIISFREDCIGENCIYRCYNLFDITDLNNIIHTSFASVLEDVNSFGDFNSDGLIDFLRFAPSSNAKDPTKYIVTAYSISGKKNRSPKMLKNSKGNPYYLKIESNNITENFKVMSSEWFFPLKIQEGEYITSEPYFPSYTSFDPYYKHLYDIYGVRIEKNKWSIYINELLDLESAKDYCRFVKSRIDSEEVYILVDQYSGSIKYLVLGGNFIYKNSALKYKQELENNGIKGILIDFSYDY